MKRSERIVKIYHDIAELERLTWGNIEKGWSSEEYNRLTLDHIQSVKAYIKSKGFLYRFKIEHGDQTIEEKIIFRPTSIKRFNVVLKRLIREHRKHSMSYAELSIIKL